MQLRSIKEQFPADFSFPPKSSSEGRTTQKIRFFSAVFVIVFARRLTVIMQCSVTQWRGRGLLTQNVNHTPPPGSSSLRLIYPFCVFSSFLSFKRPCQLCVQTSIHLHGLIKNFGSTKTSTLGRISSGGSRLRRRWRAHRSSAAPPAQQIKEKRRGDCGGFACHLQELFHF